MKTVVGIADLHCGHRVGLTPKRYQSALCGEKYRKVQIELWDEYERMVSEHHAPDVLIVNGDCVDGKGARSGASELVTADLNRQIEMAVECIEMWDAKSIVMTYGTPYHVSGYDDCEKIIARQVGAKEIRSHLWLDIEGVIFDVRHKINSTSTVHKGTPLTNQWLHNTVWSLHDEQPKADILLRGHVHNFFECRRRDWMGMTMPALQGQGSKFGARICDGHVDWGIVFFTVDKGGYTWGFDMPIVESAKQEALKL